MSTAEEVFHLYERNSRYYHERIQENNIENYDESYSDIKQEVFPFTIGDQDTPCEYKIKCYIKPGDECPICFDKILTKSSAYISYCGHHYHKKCISKYMEIKWSSKKYTTTVRCPMCRCALGHPDFIRRYRSNYFDYNYKNDNELDKLEDFWISKDYRLPSFCTNGYDHYLGMDKSCFCCKCYRETGACYT
jgi:hypothetical protein